MDYASNGPDRAFLLYGIRPYMYEPESEPEREADETEVVKPPRRSKKKVSKKCTCGNRASVPPQKETVRCKVESESAGLWCIIKSKKKTKKLQKRGKDPSVDFPGNVSDATQGNIDGFQNQAQFNPGFAEKLTPKEEPILTVTIKSEYSASQPGTSGSSCQILHGVRHVASQTDPPERQTVSTQLSMVILQEPLERKPVKSVRSKATQVKMPSRDCGVSTDTFPLDSPLLLLQPTIVQRPSKRPRLSLTDKEEGPRNAACPE